jgi:hypothetical protein
MIGLKLLSIVLFALMAQFAAGDVAPTRYPEPYPHVPPDEAQRPDLDAATDERISATRVSVHWREKDIEDCLHELQSLCHRANPKLPNITFRLDLTVKDDPSITPHWPIRRVISLSFDNVSIRNILAYIAPVSRTGFVIRRNEIVFMSMNTGYGITHTFFLGPRADAQ